MVYERNSDCWYRNVCSVDACDGCVRYMEMAHLIETSGIPKSRQQAVLLDAGDDLEAFRRLNQIKLGIVEFVNSGKNLYICSANTGNGKTTWTIKILLRYFDQIWSGNGFRTRGLMVHVPTLLMQLKNFENPLSQEYKSLLLSADVVVWDDIAHTGVSQYDYNNLLMYLDNRLFSGKSNIYTSNIVSKHGLDQCLGAKLASRIWETSEVIEFRGKDRRHG